MDQIYIHSPPIYRPYNLYSLYIYIAYIAYVDGPISSQIPMSSPILMLLPAWNHRKFTCRPPGIADAQLWPLSVKYSVGPLWWTPRLMSNCLRCSSARTLCLGSELPENTQPSFNKMIQLKRGSFSQWRLPS